MLGLDHFHTWLCEVTSWTFIVWTILKKEKCSPPLYGLCARWKKRILHLWTVHLAHLQSAFRC